MAVRCPIGTANKILKDQILDYSNYENELLKVIGYPGYQHQDCKVKDFFTYSQWIEEFQKYPVIKVEGIEQQPNILNQFKHLNPKNIHLFVSQKFGHSFNWHRDDINVLLYVLKGRKTLYLRDKIFEINSGGYAIIPKGWAHKVNSVANTWALSVGY